jgi:predicted RNase H-like HicB family nuclease
MGRTIEVVIFREGDQWVAQALNVDISSFGDTAQAARDAIREALELYFEDAPDAEVREVAEERIERLSI